MLRSFDSARLTSDRVPGVLALGVAALACILLLSKSSADAHPAHLVEPIDVENNRYAPAAVTIREGSSVAWRFTNSIPHSVKAAPGSSMSFDSGLRTVGDSSFKLRFDEPGTFSYFSEGSPRIEGTINVQPLPGSPPAISKLKVKSQKKPKANFQLNKGGSLVGRIHHKKKGKWKRRASFSRNVRQGKNKITLPRGKLKSGRHRLKITVYDSYSREDSATTKFKVR